MGKRRGSRGPIISDADSVTNYLREGGDPNFVLRAATRHGYLYIVRILVENGLSREDMLRGIQWSIHVNHFDIARFLAIHCGIIPASDECDQQFVDYLIMWNVDPSTILQWACLHGQLGMCRIALRRGADVTDSNFLLELVCDQGHLDVFRFLVDECGVCANNQHILHFAILRGHATIVEFMVVRYGMDVGNVELDVNLHTSAMVDVLLKHGARDIDHQVFKRAVRYGKTDVVKILLDHYAVTGAVNGLAWVDDNWAIRMASRYGYLDMVVLLISFGANPRVLDDYCLRLAAGYGHLSVVKYLVEFGLDVSARSNAAIQWAAVDGYYDVVSYLLQAGAEVDSETVRVAVKGSHTKVVQLVMGY